MLRIRRSGWLAALVTAAGRGNPGFDAACDAIVRGTHALDVKLAPCGSTGGHVITRDECPDWVGYGCTDSDRALIQSYGTCLSNLPTCSPETRATFMEQWDACLPLIQPLSNGCPSL